MFQVFCRRGTDNNRGRERKGNLALVGQTDAYASSIHSYSRPIQRGEPVYIDLGASYQGYCGDLSRTVFLGPPTSEQANILEFALAATEAVKQAARPGIPARRLREVGNEVANQFGLQGKGHGTGHGIGCSLREEPLLDPDNELLLQPGMTISLEPMYVGELGTAVIEDNILITEDGSEYLSHCPRRNWI